MIHSKAVGGSVWESNPPFDPRRTESPALKAGEITGPLSPPSTESIMRRALDWTREDHDASPICIFYHALGPARAALLRKMQAEIQPPGMGPETLRSFLAQMRPADFGFSDAEDEVLNRFSGQAADRGFRNPDFQHHIHSMGGARGIAARCNHSHYVGSLRAAPTTKIDERTAVWTPRR